MQDSDSEVVADVTPPVEMRSFQARDKVRLQLLTSEEGGLAEKKPSDKENVSLVVDTLQSTLESPSSKRAKKERQRRSPHLPKSWRTRPSYQDEDVPRRQCLNCTLCLDCERGFTFPQNSGKWYWKGRVPKPRYAKQWRAPVRESQ